MVIEHLARIADAWIGRKASPEPAALAAVEGRNPAVVVTGGSAGIGLAIGRRFAAAGRDVVLVARGPVALEEAASAIRSAHPVRAEILALDITLPDAPAVLEARLATAGLYLDVLVNNAGIGMAGAFAEGDAARLDQMLELNVAAASRLMRHVLPAMLARGRGGVLNVASLGAYTPGPYQAAYYASKAYLLSLTEAVGYEIAGRGVRCSVVVPGPVETGFHAAMGAARSPYRRAMPSASPDAVARAAYRGYRLGRRVVAPGLLATLLMPIVRALPHPVLLPIIGTLLKPWRGP